MQTALTLIHSLLLLLLQVEGSYGEHVVHVRENVVAPQEMVTACSPPDDGREW